jgi:hypothetical protein
MFALNDLLHRVGIAPEHTMVMRHRPTEADLRRALPWLAEEDPEHYNAYQRLQGEVVERALGRAKHLVSLIGHQPGHAVFIGVYGVDGWQEMTSQAWRALPTSSKLLALGDRGPAKDRQIRFYDLPPKEELSSVKGRLVIKWSGLERSWWRWADRNDFPVHAIHEESVLSTSSAPAWNTVILTRAQLHSLPRSWKEALAQWRGVYHILDRVSGKAYVGSAYGAENILSRWLTYAQTGHGGNVELKGIDPANFQFSILGLLSPESTAEEVIHVEGLWKDRLGTRLCGLNRN